MLADHRGAYLEPIHSVMSIVVSPVEMLVDVPISFMHWLGDSLTSQQTLLTENKTLRTQVLRLNTQVQILVAQQQENQQLQTLLESNPQIAGKAMVAQLLSVDPSPLTHEVVIRKGSRDGVFMGQPVLDASGIMGQVIQVGPFTSHVLLLTDVRSAIPVQDSRTGYRAIAQGDGSYYRLKLADVPETAQLQVGDVLMTSGLGQRFPVGYPVGVITRIQHVSGQTFSDIEIRPSAWVNRSRLVLLIWPEKKPGTKPGEHHA